MGIKRVSLAVQHVCMYVKYYCAVNTNNLTTELPQLGLLVLIGSIITAMQAHNTLSPLLEEKH